MLQASGEGHREPLPLIELNHVALETSRPEESERFYRELLGFVPLVRPPFAFRGAWLRGPGLTIHLVESTRETTQPDVEISSRRDHLAFAVEKVGPVKAILEAAGIAYREQVNAGGAHQIFFQDPDGHHLELAVYPVRAGQEARQEG